MPLISAEIPDWSRETPQRAWDPGRKLLKTIRDYARLSDAKGPLASLRRKAIVLRHRFWSAITGCDIPLGCDLGGGLLLPHPNGIVIHPDARVGPNCLLMQQTTLGVSGDGGLAPTLGGHVDVSAGAKVIGEITVGDHAVIGANAVVVKNVEAFAIVGGVPATFIKRNKAAEDAVRTGADAS